MRAGILLVASSLGLLAADWPGPLVTTGWLAAHLGRPELVLLHVGAAADYAQGHIPGARLIELADVSVTGEDGLRVQLAPVERLTEALRRVGLSENSRVVVYAGGAPLQVATRVFFTLDYLGLGSRAALLDGGLAAWQAEGRPLSRDSVPAPAGNFTPSPSPERVVDASWLRLHEAPRSFTLLDARLPEFYSGANPGAASRAGHIPGARNVPFTTLLDAQGRFRSREELAAIFEAAGARRDAPVVVYCHVGVQASALYFAARYLGYDVRLYDGSFEDWSRRADLPVASAAANPASSH
jgi:thiosulfate/3-mercaptopyruvate sulfurtransferase